MYVICCGMFRSGSTWQYLIASELVERLKKGKRLGFKGADGLPTHSSREIAVIKIHEFDPRFQELLASNRAKGIYSYRDIRDVAYSLMHKMMMSFEQIVAPDGPVREALAAYYQWTSSPNVLVQPYELIVNNPELAARQIAEHLELQPGNDNVAYLVEQFSLQQNRKRARALADALQAQGVDLESRENALRHDPHTLLHWNHIREGVQDNWSALATPEEASILQQIAGDWLIEVGIE